MSTHPELLHVGKSVTSWVGRSGCLRPTDRASDRAQGGKTFKKIRRRPAAAPCSTFLHEDVSHTHTGRDEKTMINPIINQYGWQPVRVQGEKYGRFWVCSCAVQCV